LNALEKAFRVFLEDHSKAFNRLVTPPLKGLSKAFEGVFQAFLKVFQSPFKAFFKTF